MAKKRNKEPEPSSKQAAFNAEVDRYIAAGMSSHFIAEKFHLPLESTENLIRIRTEAVKNSASNQRILLRQLFRDAVPRAVNKINSLISGDYEKTEDGIANANIQMKASDILLKHAVKFIDEDVVTAWIERPTFAQEKNKLFQYTAEIDSSGSVILSAEVEDDI